MEERELVPSDGRIFKNSLDTINLTSHLLPPGFLSPTETRDN